MPLHLYTVMSRIPALIATHANRWFIIGGSEEKIKIKKSILLQTLDWPLDVDKYGLTVVHTCRYAILFFFGWNHWVHEGTCCIYTAYMYRYVIFTGTKF